MIVKTVIVDDEFPSLVLLRHQLRNFDDIKIIGEAMDGAQAIELIEERTPDLVFLDIQLPIFNGFEILENIKVRPLIIFTTAYDKYALKAFEVNAIDYLMKPVSEQRLRKAIEKSISMISNDKDNKGEIESLVKYNREHNRFLERIMVKQKYDYNIVNVNDIDFFRIENGLVFMYSGSKKYIVDIPLSSLGKRLDPACFFRSHRNAIVNINMIKRVIPWGQNTFLLEFRNNKKVELSRRRADQFKQLVGFIF